MVYAVAILFYKLTLASTPQENCFNPQSRKKIQGMHTLDRFYYTTGLFDSPEFFQKKMFAIANELNTPGYR